MFVWKMNKLKGNLDISWVRAGKNIFSLIVKPSYIFNKYEKFLWILIFCGKIHLILYPSLGNLATETLRKIGLLTETLNFITVLNIVNIFLPCNALRIIKMMKTFFSNFWKTSPHLGFAWKFIIFENIWKKNTFVQSFHLLI